MIDEKINPFAKFDKEWALLTSGTAESFNSMTISWGGMGTLWSRPVVTVYVRPDRYTYEFLKKNEYFTVSFYDEKYRPELTVMGRESGRNKDKTALTGFSPIYLKNGITYEEARETVVCKKILMQQIDREGIPDYAKKIYVNGIEPHYIIIGEVVG